MRFSFSLLYGHLAPLAVFVDLLQVYSQALDYDDSPDPEGRWHLRTENISRVSANGSGAFFDGSRGTLLSSADIHVARDVLPYVYSCHSCQWELRVSLMEVMSSGERMKPLPSCDLPKLMSTEEDHY